MLVASIFFFSHNVLQPMKEKKKTLMFSVTFQLWSANALNMGKSKILSSAKGLINRLDVHPITFFQILEI